MTIAKVNISNLTSLWKSATQPFKTYYEDEEIGCCFVPNSQWPNKIWLKKEYDVDKLNEIKLQLKSKLNNLTFSYFDLNYGEKNEVFEHHGFEEVSLQYGMCLELTEKVKVSKELEFKLVTDVDSSKKWSQSFQKAFGYQVSVETIKKTYHSINYYLIYNQQHIIGTVISHQTRSTLGIHSLGILPNMRGSGYATQIMHSLLNKGIEKGCDFATLQASKMAKSMYERMGFTTEFKMRNYTLK